MKSRLMYLIFSITSSIVFIWVVVDDTKIKIISCIITTVGGILFFLINKYPQKRDSFNKRIEKRKRKIGMTK